MWIEQRTSALLAGLHEAGVEYVVVGGAAAVLQAAPMRTEDLDIVHRKSPENVARLLPWLLAQGAYNRADMANRKLPPNKDALLGRGHILLQTNLGKLDVLCERGDGEDYENLLPDTIMLESDGVTVRVLGLPRLIDVKARAGRAKDRAVLPVLMATLEEQTGKKT